jgi:Fe-S-cluster-containing dehydrogenase component
MRYSKQIHTYGVIKTAVKQGDKERPQNPAKIAERNRLKEICLNCKEPKCGDRCRYFAKKVRENG